MITAPSAKLVIWASLREWSVFFLLKKAHFYPGSLQVRRLVAHRVERTHNKSYSSTRGFMGRAGANEPAMAR